MTILIVGAGTWGCSIALELVRRDYSNIKVLDASPFPSPTSAGNDVNKIVEERECLQSVFDAVSYLTGWVFSK